MEEHDVGWPLFVTLTDRIESILNQWAISWFTEYSTYCLTFLLPPFGTYAYLAGLPRLPDIRYDWLKKE